MKKYTKEDIFQMVEEDDVEFIRLQFTDMYGTLKNIAITVPQLEKALNNECMFDGSSVQGFVRVDESVSGSGYLCGVPLETPVGKSGPPSVRCVSFGRHTVYRRLPLYIKEGMQTGRRHGLYL